MSYLQVENLGFTYNAGTPLENKALEGISFKIEVGNVLGILGGTGSGKTTLIKMLNGLLIPSCGRVIVDGKDTLSWGAELRRKIGVVFQNPERQLFEKTVFSRSLSDVLLFSSIFTNLPKSSVKRFPVLIAWLLAAAIKRCVINSSGCLLAISSNSHP